MPRNDYQYLRQWLLDNPLKAIDIAQTAIFGLYADRGKFDKNPEEVEFPSGADYQGWVAETMTEAGVIEAIHIITSPERPRKLPRVTHWIVSGRIPGADENSTRYLVVPEDSCPEDEFVKVMYYAGVPKGYQEGRRPTEEENFYGAWIYINAKIQIVGPPVVEDSPT